MNKIEQKHYDLLKEHVKNIYDAFEMILNLHTNSLRHDILTPTSYIDMEVYTALFYAFKFNRTIDEVVRFLKFEWHHTSEEAEFETYEWIKENIDSINYCKEMQG